MRHLNIQGLSNKIEQERLLLQSENKQIHVLGLSKSKISSFHPDSGFLLNACQIPLRWDPQENAGEFFVYVKNNKQANLEYIWLEIRLSKRKPFIIGNI